MADHAQAAPDRRAEPLGRQRTGASFRRSRAGGCGGIARLNLRQVQKKGGRIHLTVPGEVGAAVRTLCNKVLAAGDYREVDAEADCQLCRKRQDDPALVSSAFFEGHMGSQLLEMSLEKARAGRDARQAAASQSSSRHAPLRSGPPTKKGGPSPSAGSPPNTEPEREAAEKPSRIGDLELANLTQVSENVYRSPAGAVIRTRRRGADWEVAEVVFDGDVQVKRDAGGLRLKLGDVVLEYGPDRRLRARYRSG